MVTFFKKRNCLLKNRIWFYNKVKWFFNEQSMLENLIPQQFGFNDEFELQRLTKNLGKPYFSLLLCHRSSHWI